MATYANSLIHVILVISGLGLVRIGAENLQPPLTPSQHIDLLIEAKLKEVQKEPNAAIDESTFLRRAYLDLAGRIPTIKETKGYQSDSSREKRDRLIAKLLQSEAYVSHFYNFWSDILRINWRLGMNETPRAVEYAYRLWIKKALRENMPYDAFVRELVNARGHSWVNGAIGYYQRDRGMPLENMSNTVRIFLGTRLECAQCHDHPFDRWSQMDYYKMAAFSYGMESQGYLHPKREALRAHLERRRLEVYNRAVAVDGFPFFSRIHELERTIRQLKASSQWKETLERHHLNDEQFIATATRGIEALKEEDDRSRKILRAEDVLHVRVRYVTTSENKRLLRLPHDYQYSNAKPFDEVAPDPLFGPKISLSGNSSVELYADWITSRDNPTFTRVIANRLWQKMFGRGVFEPLDEITGSTAISNPALMDYLETLMRDLNYDMKAYLAVLCKTRAYQRAVSKNEAEMGSPYYFEGPTLRRMSAEQIWDSVVGLVLPEVDLYEPNLKRQLAAIDRLRTIYQSLADLPEDDYIATVEELHDAMAANLTKKNIVNDQRRKAHTGKNIELFRQKTEELKALEREVGEMISHIQSTRRQDLSDTERLASFGMAEIPTATERNFQVKEASKTWVATKRHKPKFPKPPPGLDAHQLKEWRTLRKAEYDRYLKVGLKWARASALDSPAPRGHFLREFGQSDREVIENATDQASVPQSLALLNGPVGDALTNRFGVLGSHLQAVATPEKKVALLFQAMLTRKPNEREKKLARAELTEYGEQAYHNLVWALLNTGQFLFIR